MDGILESFLSFRIITHVTLVSKQSRTLNLAAGLIFNVSVFI